jgi:precorrin-3B methylase
MSLGGYEDTFYRGVKCDADDPNKVDGWRYDVSALTAGVAYIHRTEQRCQKENLKEEALAQIVHAENAMELAEDGEDISAAEMVTGGDANGNGVADLVDVAKYAGSGEVHYGPAVERYVEWAVDVHQAVRLVDL